jgi:transaldolase
MPESRLHSLAAAGVSVWSDQISRTMLRSGELIRRMSLDAVTGVTSNPTIFAGAITKSQDYDHQLKELASAGLSTEEIAAGLMTSDIQEACDVIRPAWERAEGRDGYVSVEVSPLLAHDTDATIAEAREWVKRIDRPNLLVKVPATLAGIPAIRQLIGEGISVNVTLTFSLERYRQVIGAYMDGIRAFAALEGRLDQVASVASFFVSRMDTEVDKRLEGIGTPEALSLRGRAAIANARMAYAQFLELFRRQEWQEVAAQGARIQRPLWASTSTKNPAYSDVLYVEGLVAPHTVNTMPLDTIDAYQHHGTPYPMPFGPADIDQARQTLRRLAEVGIDYDDVVRVLEEEGVDKFSKSWVELLTDIEKKAARIARPS